jgi:hypothetical protein
MVTAIDGFQGPPGHLSDNDHVHATAKHDAGDGDGDTAYGTGSGDYEQARGLRAGRDLPDRRARRNPSRPLSRGRGPR